jgi:hypothetical protein
MNTYAYRSDRTGKVRIVTTLGDTQLVRHVNSRYELRGGSVADHTDAMEWISIFRHEAVVSFPPITTTLASSTGTGSDRLPTSAWASHSTSGNNSSGWSPSAGHRLRHICQQHQRPKARMEV